MTKETIFENCQRLLTFLKDEKNIPIITDNILPPIELLNHYELILDVNGCPSKGLSVLYIKDKKEFEELKTVASEIGVETFKEYNKQMDILDTNYSQILSEIYHPKFSFLHNGYYWEVENR